VHGILEGGRVAKPAQTDPNTVQEGVLGPGCLCKKTFSVAPKPVCHGRPVPLRQTQGQTRPHFSEPRAGCCRSGPQCPRQGRGSADGFCSAWGGCTTSLGPSGAQTRAVWLRSPLRSRRIASRTHLSKHRLCLVRRDRCPPSFGSCASVFADEVQACVPPVRRARR